MHGTVRRELLDDVFERAGESVNDIDLAKVAFDALFIDAILDAAFVVVFLTAVDFHD